MKKLIFVFGVLITGTVFGQTAIKLTDFPMSWNKGDSISDSIKRTMIEDEIIKQLNAFRTSNDMKALVKDTGLRAAAVHNAIYNRWCFANRILQSEYTTCFMTHLQYKDMPDFEEINAPAWRIKLLDQTKFKRITEELTYDLSTIGFLEKQTMKQRATQVISQFKASDAHWKDMASDAAWDCVYVFYDLNTWTVNKGTSTVVYVILGEYN